MIGYGRKTNLFLYKKSFKITKMKKKHLENLINVVLKSLTNEIKIGYFKEKYSEPHRYYHTWEHILYMVDKAEKYGYLYNNVILAILFHDIVYDPLRKDNEEKSSELFKSFFPDNEIVYNAILNTKTHTDGDDVSRMLNILDLYVLTYGTLGDFMKYEDNIFKEYQFVDLNVYKKNRIEFLQTNFKNIKPEYIDYIRNREYKIGVYVGSFNPFHKGHLNILEKAEQIFDKVIIARGINPSKTDELLPLPDCLKYRQSVLYDGLLTDFIDSLGYEVTLIRGLRNSTDLQFETTQYRFLKDLKPDIKVVNILSDVQFEHISSSSIKMLQKYGKGDQYLL